jgi:hypothetical protein
VVVTDLQAFVLINVYVPNAGSRSGDSARVDFKVRFLKALKEKCDSLSAAGRQACTSLCAAAIRTYHRPELPSNTVVQPLTYIKQHHTNP